MLSILETVQPNDFNTDIPEDAARLAFRPLYGRGRNRRSVKHGHPKLNEITFITGCKGWYRRKQNQAKTQGWCDG